MERLQANAGPTLGRSDEHDPLGPIDPAHAGLWKFIGTLNNLHSIEDRIGGSGKDTRGQLGLKQCLPSHLLNLNLSAPSLLLPYTITSTSLTNLTIRQSGQWYGDYTAQQLATKFGALPNLKTLSLDLNLPYQEGYGNDNYPPVLHTLEGLKVETWEKLEKLTVHSNMPLVKSPKDAFYLVSCRLHAHSTPLIMTFSLGRVSTFPAQIRQFFPTKSAFSPRHTQPGHLLQLF